MKKQEKIPLRQQPTPWLRQNRPTVLVLLGGILFFVIAALLLAPKKEAGIVPAEFSEYETARVEQVLTDTCEPDPTADGSQRGEQSLIVTVTSGRYKGEQLQVSNYVGPLYGVPVKAGESAVLIISTYADGSHYATVHEFNRIAPLCIVLSLFLLISVLVGGRTGAKSLVGLVLTLACLFFVLIPGLMKGFPTLPTVFVVCCFIAIMSLTILGGVSRKTVSAMAGAVAGTALALLFGLLSQSLLHIDGLRLEDVEPLLQLRQTGTPLHLRGLLVGGVAISALGAVMDVTMGIASSLSEVYDADPTTDLKGLLRSGMNIGRDMVGTMTNTLILALLGGSFSLIIYLYSLGLSTHQLLSSAYLSLEVISSVSASVGVILSIPVTAFISAWLLTQTRNSRKKS